MDASVEVPKLEVEEAEGSSCEKPLEEGAPSKHAESAPRPRMAFQRLRSVREGGPVKRVRSEDDGECSEPPPQADKKQPQPSDAGADVAESTVGIVAAGGKVDRPVPVAREEEEVKAEAGRFPCVSHGTVSVIGRRRSMEDAVAVAPALLAEVAEGHDFFAVYDGHGGPRVAEACRQRLHAVLAEEAAARGGWPRLGAEEERRWWTEALAASFARVDGEVAREADRTEGSTAVVAVVGPRCIVVANCGDSRAVLSRAGAPVPLSTDHKPDRPDELERVEAAGGSVIEWNGCRVLGVLATSRSIGDYQLKPFVSAEPEVTVTERMEGDEFLILASDGLWDVMSNEVACRITRHCLTGQAERLHPRVVNGRTAAEAAALLVEFAIARGSRDNISVIVVELKRMGPAGDKAGPRGQ